MTPLDLLCSIRVSNLHDDQARVLLAIGSGSRRYTDILDATILKETQLRKMLHALAVAGLIEVQTAPRGAAGRGKCSIYSLLPKGLAKVREILQPPPARRPRRAVPAGVKFALAVKGGGTCFLH